VIVSAWRSDPDWLEQCLLSIALQVLPEGWSFEVRIGVDGCPETSALLTRMGSSHWYSEENVGPYLVRNSLILKPPEPDQPEPTHYATFDADDVMRPGYLHTLCAMAGSDVIAGPARVTMTPEGIRKPGRAAFQGGVACYPVAVLVALGGFRPWRIAADSDLVRRARAMGFTVKSSSEVLYDRRRHPDSLTQREDVGMRSDVRNALTVESERAVRAGELVAEFETVPLRFVELPYADLLL